MRANTSWTIEVLNDEGSWQIVERFRYRMHTAEFISVCENYTAYWDKYGSEFQKFRLVQNITESVTLLEERI